MLCACPAGIHNCEQHFPASSGPVAKTRQIHAHPCPLFCRLLADQIAAVGRRISRDSIPCSCSTPGMRDCLTLAPLPDMQTTHQYVFLCRAKFSPRSGNPLKACSQSPIRGLPLSPLNPPPHPCTLAN